MHFCQVVGCGEAVAAATYDDDVVVFLRLWIAPHTLPVLVMTQRIFQQAESRVPLHSLPLVIQAEGRLVGSDLQCLF